MIILVSHASVIDGKIHEVPVNTIVEILRDQKHEFVFIRHSMNGDFSSIAYFYKNGQVITNKKIPVLSRISVFIYNRSLVYILFCLFHEI
jgi:hypothetical protein